VWTVSHPPHLQWSRHSTFTDGVGRLHARRRWALPAVGGALLSGDWPSGRRRAPPAIGRFFARTHRRGSGRGVVPREVEPGLSGGTQRQRPGCSPGSVPRALRATRTLPGGGGRWPSGPRRFSSGRLSLWSSSPCSRPASSGETQAAVTTLQRPVGDLLEDFKGKTTRRERRGAVSLDREGNDCQTTKREESVSWKRVSVCVCVCVCVCVQDYTPSGPH